MRLPGIDSKVSPDGRGPMTGAIQPQNTSEREIHERERKKERKKEIEKDGQREGGREGGREEGRERNQSDFQITEPRIDSQLIRNQLGATWQFPHTNDSRNSSASEGRKSIQSRPFIGRRVSPLPLILRQPTSGNGPRENNRERERERERERKRERKREREGRNTRDNNNRRKRGKVW